MLAQRAYHNFKAFRIFDLSGHKLGSQHLIVRVLGALAGWSGLWGGKGASQAIAALAMRTRRCPASRPPACPAPRAPQGHPMALQRLAAFFQDHYYQARGARKPVMLIGPRTEGDRCLVIGYEATQRMRVRGRAGGQATGRAWDAVVLPAPRHQQLTALRRPGGKALRLLPALPSPQPPLPPPAPTPGQQAGHCVHRGH